MKAEYVDHMGSDLSVVNAARVSFAKVSSWDVIRNDVGGDHGGSTLQLKEADQGLIAFLAREGHTTPFYHTAISLRCSAPVPIRTQAFKHHIGLEENEESRRYISSRPVLFIPEEFRKKPEGSIKQGSGFTHINSDFWKACYIQRCNKMVDLYEQMIEDGVCPEQARLVLPQGVEVQWIWTGNLFAYANFYRKRSDPHAQLEIQHLASQVRDIIRPLFPHSWDFLTA